MDNVEVYVIKSLMSKFSPPLFLAIVSFILAWGLGCSRVAMADAPGVKMNEKVVMTVASWPPYSGADLPDQGACVVVARAAFAAVGIELELRFYPWKRVLTEAALDPEIVGYFPEYYSELVIDDFLFSDPMGWGPVGLMYPAGSGFDWHDLDDFNGKRIGVVADYVNEKEFDVRIAAGRIKGVEVVDDPTLIRMTALGRVDAAVIDPHVYHYSMLQPDIRVGRGKIYFHPKMLTEHTLHLTFKRTPEGKRLRKLFNEGLRRVDIRDVQESYLEKQLRRRGWPGR